MTPEALHVRIADGQGVVTPEPFRREVRVLLSPLLQPQLVGTGVMVGYTEVQPGQQGSRHKHPSEAELWLFFAGTGRAVVGDQDFLIHPGSVVYTPPDTYHQFFNTGAEAVKLFWSYSPPGAERAILEGAFR
jgi:mannose-6-phosphate isomerase-like protein (cupin superfamily)